VICLRRTLCAGLLACMALAVAACDSRPKTESKPAQIFQEQRQALDKAKGVQDTVDKQAAEQRKKIDEASK
jgi:hypothetical protein